jgi:ankyrin repeat protein/tetratricopeptide (TPR) repeat protein
MQAESTSANGRNEGLEALHRMVSNIESTLAGRQRTQVPYIADETAMYAHANELLSSVRGFASNASTISTAGSTTPTVTGAQRALTMRYAPESLVGETLGLEKHAKISRWIPPPMLMSHTPPFVETLQEPSLSPSSQDDKDLSSNTSISKTHLFTDLEEEDLELVLLEKRLSKGQLHFDAGRFALAIPFFTKSLESMNEPSFKSKTALTVDDVHLMLARIYAKMERLEDAEKLLGPLSQNETQPDSLVLLAAKHLLAEIWAKQEQFDRARIICLETAKRRQKLLGTSSTLFHESAGLLIQIYKSQGDNDEAELWQDLLPPPQLQKFIQMAKEIDTIRAQGESGRAADLAIEFLKTYPIRTDCVWRSEKNELWTDMKMPELRENVMKSSGVGLAGCGYGFTPLHLMAASSSDCAAEVQYLIDCGIDINCTWEFRYNTNSTEPFDGVTPLMTAALFENNNVVNVLLKNGAEVNLQDSDKKTALHWACIGIEVSTGKASIAKMLLDYGADIEARDKWGNAPLFLAAFNHQTAIVDLLIASGANQEVKNDGGLHLIHAASEAKYPALMEKLLDKGADIEAKDKYGQTPLYMAVWEGKVKNVETLLYRGANIKVFNCNSMSVLHSAVQKDHLDVVEVLLKYARDSSKIDLSSWVNAKDKGGGTALYQAARKGHTAILEKLFNAGAKIETLTSASWNALHIATQYGHFDVIELLLKFARESSKIDMSSWVNTKTKKGDTALHQAAWKGHTAILEKLLDAGVKIETLTNGSQNALHCAAQEGHLDVIEVLLKSAHKSPKINLSSWVNTKDGYGETALHTGAWKGHTAILEKLLDAGAGIDLKSKNGWTALQLATHYKRDEAVKTLKKRGADPTPCDCLECIEKGKDKGGEKGKGKGKGKSKEKGNA